ncbi:MAG: hypothetical protein HZA31_12040 [Opitutae bacterium]|nr:hypothetical protein [Opitutae bacterium]
MLIGLLTLGGAWWASRQNAQQLDAEATRLRAEIKTLAALRAEHQRLRGQQVSTDTLQRLRDDHAALAPLREEIGLLRTQREKASQLMPASLVVRPLVPASAWTNAGRATPQAALESMLWAATQGDITVLCNALDFQASRRQLDAMFATLPEATRAQYGTAEKVFGTLLAAHITRAVDAMGEVVMPSLNSGSSDRATVIAQLQAPDNQIRDRTYLFARSADGWRMVVPIPMLESFAALLKTKPLPQSSAKPNAKG